VEGKLEHPENGLPGSEDLHRFQGGEEDFNGGFSLIPIVLILQLICNIILSPALLHDGICWSLLKTAENQLNPIQFQLT